MSDASNIYKSVVAEREHLRWNGTIDRMQSVEDLADGFADESSAAAKDDLLGGAIEYEGRIAGRCVIKGLKESDQRGVLAYWLFGWAQGLGIATSSARTLIETAFEETNVPLIEIPIVSENIASQKLAKRLGAELLTIRPDAIFRRGRSWDAHVFGVHRTNAS